ncbi:sensor histidine kinase [Phytohabitans suffuscus]|uniref:histidine kinase n=1 Tax=Phytohabitans suffuscus TaxID=624315 RepID=A0A6F8YAG3_9ACTN|nr:ATP-binding protein [Phytohabitans suffuscus]BCB83013.1 histidine kinase [Phytohabitans suffuscus]
MSARTAAREADVDAVAGARVRGERISASVVVASRLGALVLLATTLLADLDDLRRAPYALVVALVVAESAVLIGACLRARHVARRWVMADAAFLAVSLWCAGRAPVVDDSTGVSVLYNFATVASIALGLPAWSLGTAVATAFPLIVANIGVALPDDPRYPLWNAVPDSLVFLGNAVVVWVIASLVRWSAAALDRHRATVVTRAETLARERERARQGRALGARLLSTLEQVAATPGAVEPALRAHVEAEVAWLRAMVRDGLPDDTGDLRTMLLAVAGEKTAQGMRVAVQVPDELPDLTQERVAALAGAAREALTNVGRHAGTNAARLSVAVADALTVEVVDEGRGYDPARRPAGTGQLQSIGQRMAEVGGAATIASTPGLGTRVVLRVPVGRR